VPVTTISAFPAASIQLCPQMVTITVHAF
jgi:hypothetical protein